MLDVLERHLDPVRPLLPHGDLLAACLAAATAEAEIAATLTLEVGAREGWSRMLAARDDVGLWRRLGEHYFGDKVAVHARVSEADQTIRDLATGAVDEGLFDALGAAGARTRGRGAPGALSPSTRG